MFKHRKSRLARNPMSFELGLDYRFYQNITAIKEYIAFLEKEFDLVMISDYFDESVVLMKRLLCWEFDDILYFKANKRIDKERAVDLNEDAKENIKRWNKAVKVSRLKQNLSGETKEKCETMTRFELPYIQYLKCT